MALQKPAYESIFFRITQELRVDEEKRTQDGTAESHIINEAHYD